MAIVKTSDTARVVLSNAKYIHVTPYETEDTLGADTYNIVDIVGDTLSFTPDDNTINAKESEFKDDPLFENVTLGKYQFAGTCIDFQNVVMAKIYGWETDENDNVYAPVGYKDKYALIEVGFRNEKVVVVAPKVKLNSKATLANLKTGTSEGAMAGTAYSADLNEKPTPLAILKAETGEETYTVKVGGANKTFTVGKGLKA